METPKIEVNAPKDGVLTILTGEAEVIKYKQNLILQGNLESLMARGVSYVLEGGQFGVEKGFVVMAIQ